MKINKFPNKIKKTLVYVFSFVFHLANSYYLFNMEDNKNTLDFFLLIVIRLMLYFDYFVIVDGCKYFFLRG